MKETSLRFDLDRNCTLFGVAKKKMRKLYQLGLFIAFAVFADALLVNKYTTTVSGISAGASFAIQFQIAFSDVIHGAGIVAGTPYYCGLGKGKAAALDCNHNPQGTDVAALIAATKGFESDGNIASLSNLANRSILLFSGQLDSLVPNATVVNVQQQFQGLGVKSVPGIFNVAAKHAWITSKYGNDCSVFQSPYVNNCNLPFGGVFLRDAFESMNIGFRFTENPYVAQSMLAFDQTQFGADARTNSMASIGYYYVPDNCKNEFAECHIHVNFHGCNQNYDTVGLEYVSSTEINEYAETNNIIVLYPQATASSQNSKACFDWWGYTGSDFAFQSGAQMKLVMSVIQYLQDGNLLPVPSSEERHEGL